MKKHKKARTILLVSAIFSMSIANAKSYETGSISFVKDSTVTALGIEKAARTLPYHIQKIEGTELVKVKDGNFVNSLIGRIAGATINTTSTGAGGSVRVIMRGLRSLSGNNNVLYVLDGIPLPQLSSEQPKKTNEGMGQSGDGIFAINPDDIESISVLTGAAASVLYGNDGANGVIMITTKKGQAGKLSVNISNSTTFSSPLVMPEFQNTYNGWEDKLKYPTNWNPSDFFQTGHTINNSVSLSGGSKVNQTYFSAATQNSKGIIPNNDVNRYHISVRNTSNLLKERLKLDLIFRYTNANEQNMLSQGQLYNPLVPIYMIPDVMLAKGDDKLPGNPYKDYYERYDPSLGYNVQYWPLDGIGAIVQNPYWTINRDIFKNRKNRFLAGLGATFNINEWLKVSAQMQYDRDNEKRTQKKYASTRENSSATAGLFQKNDAKATQFYSDLMLTVNKPIGNFSIDATLGGSIRSRWYDHSIEGGALQIANLFSISNLKAQAAFKNEADYHDQTKSAFVAAQLGYKNGLYLDVAGRMDWLNFKDEYYKNVTFSADNFYPSAGLSLVPTEWFSSKSDILSFMKVHYSYSEAGNSFQYYIPINNIKFRMNEKSLIGDMDPERTKSHEVGLNASFLKNKISLSFTMYKTTTDNLQYNVTWTESGGREEVRSRYGPRIDNKGIELTLGVNQDLGAVKWNSNLTYSINKNKIKCLVDDIPNPLTGENISIDEIIMSREENYKVSLKKGGSVGDIYVYAPETDKNGKVIIDKNSENLIKGVDYIRAGNVNPDYTIGWANNFAWKGLELSFVIHARFGGVGLSLTQATMDKFGVSKSSAIARDNGSVWLGSEQIPTQKYYQIIDQYKIGSIYTYDATNIRLAEMSVGYNIPVNKWVKWIKGARISLIGRNLFMLYNKAPFDPESAAGNDNFYQGIEYFRQPSLRNMGFSVNLKF